MIQNNFPDIDCKLEYNNPTIASPSSPFEIQFYQTRDSLLDIEDYKNFIQNCISRFRKSRTYKNYKSYLINLGMNTCQFNSNITTDMASIEMHHNMITIFDIAIIICEHQINTVGYVTSYDVVNMIAEVHKKNQVQLIMLGLTAHQLYHNAEDFFIHPDMCFGDWFTFLQNHRYGITKDISFKILFYLKRAIKEDKSNEGEYLKLVESITDWSYANQYL